MATLSLTALLERALAARADWFDDRRETAFRLFNGFLEGAPELAADLYATTAVLHNYANPPAAGAPLVAEAARLLLKRLPWLEAIIVKTRHGAHAQEQRGRLIHGARPADRISEHGVWYAVDLLLNRDASLYLDTRNLRRWAIERLAGKTVFNTFAYTGSLGVAAHGGRAARVVQHDRTKLFLNLAKTSYTLNGFPIAKQDFVIRDFWSQVNHFKQTGQRFDCVFVDPPFFAAGQRGVVDLAQDYARLINKVRPLVAHDGWLVAINNALFVSGAEFMAQLQSVCADGYVSIEETIPIAADFAGFEQTRAGAPPADPAPFNHSTKIAVLRVRHRV